MLYRIPNPSFLSTAQARRGIPQWGVGIDKGCDYLEISEGTRMIFGDEVVQMCLTLNPKPYTLPNANGPSPSPCGSPALVELLRPGGSITVFWPLLYQGSIEVR